MLRAADKITFCVFNHFLFLDRSNFPQILRPKAMRAVELAGLDVEGCSLLDGAEAGDAEGLTGLGDGVDPATDVLELTAAEGVLLLGDDLSALALHELGFVHAGVGVVAGSVPDLAAGSTDANTTGHIELLSLCERATNGIR